MYLTLGAMLNLSAAESDEETYETVYTKNGATSVQLPCGEDAHSALGVEWFAKERGKWLQLLRFHLNNPGRSDYFKDAAKYNVSESVNTSLVVKKLKPSDSLLFRCAFIGTPTPYRYIMLQVVGKSLYTYLFTPFALVLIKMCNPFKVSGNFKDLELSIEYPLPKRYFNLCTDN